MRVLPLPGAITKCIDAGFSPSHVIGMQGPFTRELNEAMLRQVGAQWLVTKDSGTVGGTAEKLAAARDVLGLPENYLSGVELTVDDVYKADKISTLVSTELGSPFYVRSWMEMNANLFAALKLEKIGMFILLTMVVLIGSFSIVTTLVMLVMEKTRDIAIMMSMGATRGMIRRIFMLQGSIIGVIGTLLGYALGLSLGWLLKRYQHQHYALGPVQTGFTARPGSFYWLGLKIAVVNVLQLKNRVVNWKN